MVSSFSKKSFGNTHQVQKLFVSNRPEQFLSPTLSNIESMQLSVRDIIQSYFGSAEVGEAFATLFDGYTGPTLEKSGYYVCPRFYVKFDDNLPSGYSKDYTLKDFDGLVCGDYETWSDLKDVCYTHHDRSGLTTTTPHVLAVVTMQSFKEVVNNIARIDSWPNIIIKNTLPSLNRHIVLFVNGNAQSREWVANGHNSPVTAHREAWETLKQANISVFYRESFGFEWVVGVTNMLDAQASKNRAQDSIIQAQDTEIQDLKTQVAEIPGLKAELATFKSQLDELLKDKTDRDMRGNVDSNNK